MPQVMDAAAKLSLALGAVGKPVQEALLRDETAATWSMGAPAASMINHTRPHTIFR
jgi:hypothetical protein